MALTVTLLKRHATGGMITFIFRLTLSGSYPGTGEPLDFGSICGYTNRQPDYVEVVRAGAQYQGNANNMTYMYYNYTDKVMYICRGTTPNDALAPGAYPGAVSGETDYRVKVTYLGTPGV